MSCFTCGHPREAHEPEGCRDCNPAGTICQRFRGRPLPFPRTWIARIADEGLVVGSLVVGRQSAEILEEVGWDVIEVEPVAPNLTKARNRAEDEGVTESEDGAITEESPRTGERR